MKNCKKCDLCVRRSNIVEPIINPFSDILFISEAPGTAENKSGLGYTSRAAKRFVKIVNEELNENASFTYFVKCKSIYKVGKNNIMSCKEYLLKEIEEIFKLNTIVFVGTNAANAYLNQNIILKFLINKDFVDNQNRLIKFIYHYNLLNHKEQKVKEFYINQIKNIISKHYEYKKRRFNNLRTS